MPWNDIIRRVLPPVRIDNPNGGFRVFEPHTTSSYGWRRLKDGSWEFHKAGDFNYNVGPNGQTGINLAHPELRSPVTGIVTRAGEGKYGTIAIRDANGLSHEILHTHSQHVAVGDPVVAGQIIGTMGKSIEGFRAEHAQSHRLLGSARAHRSQSGAPGSPRRLPALPCHSRCGDG